MCPATTDCLYSADANIYSTDANLHSARPDLHGARAVIFKCNKFFQYNII